MMVLLHACQHQPLHLVLLGKPCQVQHLEARAHHSCQHQLTSLPEAQSKAHSLRGAATQMPPTSTRLQVHCEKAVRHSMQTAHQHPGRWGKAVQKAEPALSRAIGHICRLCNKVMK